MKLITQPVLLIQDNGKQLVVEKKEIEQMIKDNKSIQGISSFSSNKNLKELQKDMKKIYALQKYFKTE